MSGRILDQITVYRNLLRHPLNAGRALATTRRWLGWHLGSRLVPGPVAVPFVNDTMLLVSPSMAGATQNVYSGLAEVSDMGFVLHALRSSCLFFDIGANVGVYTVLASGAVGARTVTIEPLPGTFEKLRKNIALNDLSSLVVSVNAAVGDQPGSVRMTTEHDAMNHVAVESEATNTCEVRVATIDQLANGRSPDVMKIDVEGYELPALRGARTVLASESLQAVVIELNGSGKRYDFDDRDVVDLLRSSGFRLARYDPFSRTLSERHAPDRDSNNAIFVRDLPYMQRVLREAPAYQIGNGRAL